MTSRERMLAALDRGAGDFIPCSPMSFTALRKRVHEDRYSLVDAELAMGFDSMLFIPAASRAERPEHPDLRGLPVRFARGVETRAWRDGRVLHREFVTPAGTLAASVQLSEDWPHGDVIPFVDDYRIPRALKHLVTGPGDVEPLRYLLLPPSAEDECAFRAEAETGRRFAAERGVLLAGGWGVGMDMLNWLCGMEELMVLTREQPEAVARLLQLVHEWNLRRMELVLSAPVDLYIRRAWYEGCDFVPRAFFRREVLPRLKAEAELAHERGARFGYICTSGLNPMLDFYREAGIDVLIGVDPVQGTQTDMAAIRRKLAGSVAVWGGVSGAVTVEMGTEEQVRAAVREAVAQLGPDGFILSPVDNITVDEPGTWRNLEVFVDEWRRVRALSPRA